MERPSKGPLSLLTQDQFEEFLANLGILLYNSVAGSAFARHAYPLSTVADYLDVDPGDTWPHALAKEFIRDVAKRRSTAWLAQKWFEASPEELAMELSKILGAKRQGLE